MIIAIDGPSGSGKSTVARELAKRLDIHYVDTGAMYRALALAALRRKVSPECDKELVELARSLPLTMHTPPRGRFEVWLGDENVTEAIRGSDVNRVVSLAARIPGVRSEMVKRQRTEAKKYSVVMEGRDIGTVVFPGADFKFYLDADPKLRAERRWRQIHERDPGASLSEVEKEQTGRDHLDQSRSASPLKAAPDAIRIDTTGRTVSEVVYIILDRVNVRVESKSFFYSFCRLILLVLFKLFFGFAASGPEKFPARGGFIIASNHRSFLDPIIIAITSRRQVCFIARDTLFQNPFFGLLIRGLKAYPIRRGSADRDALHQAVRLVRNGNPVLMFPEGTRSADGSFLNPKAGLGFVIARLGCPVVPVYIYGSYEAFPKGARQIKRSRIQAAVGEPIRLESLFGESINKHAYLDSTKRVMDAIQKLSPQKTA